MAEPAPLLSPTPALAGAASGRFGAGRGAPAAVTIEALADLPMTEVIAARGEDVVALLAGRVPPAALRTLGPGRRLALGAAPAALADLAPRASAVDQSGGRGRIEVRGPEAETLLARGVGADLHGARFAQGTSAPMLFGRIGIVLTRSGAQRWEILVPRSYALALWEHLVEAGRSLGIEARGPGG
ncbi:sarcosine oxidase subunit gamma family protein [uncultured Albimonas sp.]|uniref:sarcosine oxidase subunit gamma family protein n=1 Tax=uncultured Albimonas sp. TaxID=1331701 RepID=UPI0030EE32EA